MAGEVDKKRLKKMIEKECGEMPTYKEWIEDKEEWIRREGLHPVADRYILESMYNEDIAEYVMICTELVEKKMELEKKKERLEELKSKQTL